MKRALSTLLTTLLFAAAIVPNATAQMQKTTFPMGFSIGSAAIPAQPTPDATKPTVTETEVLPESPTSPALDVSKSNAEKARSSVDGSYPAYCPSLPLGTQPGDWAYREALEKCLYGS